MNIITRDTRVPLPSARRADWYAKAAGLDLLVLAPRFSLDFDREFGRQYERDEAADGRERVATGDWP